MRLGRSGVDRGKQDKGRLQAAGRGSAEPSSRESVRINTAERAMAGASVSWDESTPDKLVTPVGTGSDAVVTLTSFPAARTRPGTPPGGRGPSSFGDAEMATGTNTSDSATGPTTEDTFAKDTFDIASESDTDDTDDTDDDTTDTRDRLDTCDTG